MQGPSWEGSSVTVFPLTHEGASSLVKTEGKGSEECPGWRLALPQGEASTSAASPKGGLQGEACAESAPLTACPSGLGAALLLTLSRKGVFSFWELLLSFQELWYSSS